MTKVYVYVVIVDVRTPSRVSLQEDDWVEHIHSIYSNREHAILPVNTENNCYHVEEHEIIT